MNQWMPTLVVAGGPRGKEGAPRVWGRELVSVPTYQLMEETNQHITNWNDGISTYWLNISFVCILLGLSRAHKIPGSASTHMYQRFSLFPS